MDDDKKTDNKEDMLLNDKNNDDFKKESLEKDLEKISLAATDGTRKKEPLKKSEKEELLEKIEAENIMQKERELQLLKLRNDELELALKGKGLYIQGKTEEDKIRDEANNFLKVTGLKI